MNCFSDTCRVSNLRRNLTGLLVLVAATTVALVPRNALAETITVASLADDYTTGTLRAAIARAAVGDTVKFQSGLTGTITLNGEELLVEKNLTIEGAGAISISGNNNSRVFNFRAPLATSKISVSISGLIITGGKPNSGSGAGIWNQKNSILEVKYCTISGNTNPGLGGEGGSAGGIFNVGTLVLRDSIISNNSCTSLINFNTSAGGGIYNTGNFTINNCSINKNSVRSSYIARGGGIYSSGSLSIERSTFADNTASTFGSNGPAQGGGIYNTDILSLNNSTLSGNTVSSDRECSGGGLYSDNFNRPLTISECTVVGNTSAGYSTLSEGGGITNTYEVGTISNTIVAGNSAVGSSPDIKGHFSSGDYNLVQRVTGASLPGTHNITNFPAGVSPLANNGGPTQTMALSPSSLAVDAGDPAFDGTGQTDQRGPGYARVQNGRVDIGAFEIFIDRTAPTVVISTPTNNQVLSAPALTGITGSASDNVGISQVLIKFFRTRNGVTTFWNGSNFGAAQVLLPVVLSAPGASSTAWSFEVSVSLRSSLDAGTYSIVAYSKDAAGYTSTAIGRNFTLIKDTTAPAPIISRPGQNQNISVPSFTHITGTASDNVGVTQVLLKFFRTRNGVTSFWDGSNFGAMQTLLPTTLSAPNSTGSSWTFPVTDTLRSALDDGAYLVAAYGKDAAGNLSGAVGRNFMLYSDVTIPSASIASPTQNQNLPIASFSSISGAASDNVGVNQVLIRLFRTRSGVTEYWNGDSFGAAPTLLPVTLNSLDSTSTTWNYPVSSALTSALDSGPYLLVAYAKDEVGNQSNAVGRNFSLITGGPIQAPKIQGSAPNS